MADTDRKIIVEREGGGGAGTIVAILAFLVVVLAVLFFLFGGQFLGGSDTRKIDATVDVNLPSAGRN